MKKNSLLIALACAGVVTAVSAQTRDASLADTRVRTADPSEHLSCLRNVTTILTMADRTDALLNRAEVLAATLGPEEQARVREFVAANREQIQTIEDRAAELRADGQIADLCIAAQRLLNNLSNHQTQIRAMVDHLMESAAQARRVGVEIRKTDAMVTRAARIVHESGSQEEAFPGLRRAFEIQENAKQQFADKQFVAALRLTLKAREMVGTTVRAAMDSSDAAVLKERARQYYEQTNALIDRLAAQVDREKDPRAARLLDVAREQQQKARESVADGNPAEVIRHARKARELAMDLVQFIHHLDNVDVRGEHIQARIEQAQGIVDESGNPRAQEVLDKSHEHAQEAAAQLEQGNRKRATAEYDVAARLAAKSVDMARGLNDNKERALAVEIRKTTRIVNKAAALADSPRDQAKIRVAKELLDKVSGGSADNKAKLRMLDKATDIAFSVIAQSHRNEPAHNEPDR